MPSAFDYQLLIDTNPNLKKFLDLIGWAEGANYNVGFGNRPITNLSWHPYPARAFSLPNGSTTSAAGKYQFQRGTWESVARSLGLRDFTPRSQDVAAVALIEKRGALQDVLSGNIQNAVNKLKPEWQSFAVRPLKSIIDKFGNTANVNNIPLSNNGRTAPMVFDSNVQIIGNKNRYLIAFAILVLIFVFAFR
jgi:muramidase (phage lysozyme)